MTIRQIDRNYLSDADAETFDIADYLLFIDPVHIGAMLKDSKCRIALTRYDPLLFALVYMSKSLTDKDTGGITFADMHFDLCRQVLKWTDRAGRHARPMEYRNAYLAPRSAGKSTWLFKILPLWAAAHGHVRFVAAFTSTGMQAQRWLGNVKREIDGNALLRLDYPNLCAPAIRDVTGRAYADNASTYSSRSGFTITAVGIDSNNLGLNIDDVRPDLIIFDDVEPDEGNYSAYQKSQRLITVIDTCLGMNLRAVVVFVGTVVMMGSIFHDFVRINDGEQDEENKWVTEQRIKVHHYEPVVDSAVTGERRSYWPGQHSTKFVLSIELTNTFAKNWRNRPTGKDGEYWSSDLFVYGSLPSPAIKILSIDPAVKDKKHNDYTAMAIIAYDPASEIGNPAGGSGAFEVIDAVQMRVVPGQPFVNRVNALLATHEDIYAVLIEDNQGGMLWNALLSDLPVRLWTVTQVAPKWIRAQYAVNEYQLGKVLHRRELVHLQRQMLSFPRVMNDDLVDAVTSGIKEIKVRYALAAETNNQHGRVSSY